MSKILSAKQYCNSVFDGTHDTPKPLEEGFPLVTSKHIVGKKLDLASTYNISSEDYNSVQKRSSVTQWDILFSMIGSVGEVYLQSDPEINYAIKNIGVFSCKDEYKAKWLYYYLQSPPALTHIRNYLNGAVQKFLSLGALRDFPVLKYDTNNNTIIDILYNLDTKIELNSRIINALEAMSQTLYNYWFVQFDFPDQNGKPFKSSGGKMAFNKELKREIPAGWDVEELGKVFNTSLGGTPSTKEPDYWENGDIPWLNSGEIAEFPIIFSEAFITQKGIDNSAAELWPKGSVVISIVRYIRPSILAINACANQSVVGIYESKNLKNNFIYPYLINEVPRLMSQRTGVQQPHINKDAVDKSLIVIPTNGLLQQYDKITNPVFDKIINTSLENQQLIQLRDWLLPMLMNGQVSIK